MKTAILYLDNTTKKISDCGEPLDIEISSRNLGWNGILLEKGWSPHFFPKDIVTESFYFALSIPFSSKWKASFPEKIGEIKTEPGDIWLNPPNTPFTHEIGEPCFFIILLVDEMELYKHFEAKIPHEKLSFLSQYSVKDNVLSNIINLFYEEVKNAGRNGKLYLETLMNLLSNYFIRNYSDYQDIISNKKNAVLNQEMIESIHKYVQANIHDEISIDALAFKMGLSKYYFLKEFKNATGITPYQYIVKMKLDRAVQLLLQSDQSIAEIAVDLGFSDQSHFIKTFSSKYKVSPRRYKSSLLHK